MPDPIPFNTAKRRNRGFKADLPADDEPCPITPLGHINGHFWFLNIVGERRSLSARQLGIRAEITALFLGKMEWLTGKRFRSLDEDGNVTGFKVSKVAEYLMSQCEKAGLYGDHVVVRRAGVWPGNDGAPIAHCGDALFCAGERHEPGVKIGGQIFAAAPKEPHPDDQPAEAVIAQRICEDMSNLWLFRDDGAEIIAMGLVGQAYYAAAIGWRANGFITGPSNCGKSELLELMRKMVPMHRYTTETTSSGIASAINGQAMPAFIDEASDRGGEGLGGAMLIDMVLSASSGSGTKGLRGTADGGVRTIEIVASAIMASVTPPPMQPQHRSRFSIIELQKPPGGSDNRQAMKAVQAKAELYAGALFARALAGFERYQEALHQFRAALAAAHCVAREMDHLGAILAGAWVLMHDGVPDAAHCMDVVKMVSAFIRGHDEMADEDAPQIVLNRLLSHVVQLNRSTDQESLAGIIRTAMKSDTEAGVGRLDAVRVLDRWGIRVMRDTDVLGETGKVQPRLSLVGNALWIDPRVEPLRKIFAGTPYEGDRWIYALMRLPGVHRSKTAIRVGSLKPSKAIWLPWNDSEGDELDTG